MQRKTAESNLTGSRRPHLDVHQLAIRASGQDKRGRRAGNKKPA
jgi:hypothetical protein